MIAITKSGIGESLQFVRDDEDNHECVMIAIAILEIPRLSQELKIVREVCVRVYGCPVRSAVGSLSISLVNC